MELEAFMACNGCKELQTGGMEGKREKAERILRIRPDAIHIGVCCRTRAEAQGRWCPEICGLAALFQSKGIEIVWGTHS